MKTPLKLLVAGAMLAATALGQTTIGDASDKTALILEQGGAFSVNFADNSAKLGLLHDLSGKPWFAGMELSAKAKNGLGPLFDGENVSPETSAALSFGGRYGGGNTADEVRANGAIGGWMSLRAGYTRGAYKLYNPASPVGKRVSDRAEDLLDAALYWNKPLQVINAVVGVSLGARKASNYDDLKKVAVKETTVVEVSGATTVTSEKAIEAREGAFATFTQWECNADFFWIPEKFGHRFGLDVFIRAQRSQGDTYVSPGIGLFVLKEKSPGAAVGGLTVQYDDRENKTVVGFAVGYPFK